MLTFEKKKHKIVSIILNVIENHSKVISTQNKGVKNFLYFCSWGLALNLFSNNYNLIAIAYMTMSIAYLLLLIFNWHTFSRRITKRR